MLPAGERQRPDIEFAQARRQKSPKETRRRLLPYLLLLAQERMPRIHRRPIGSLRRDHADIRMALPDTL